MGVDILGVDILGIDILGVDILGIDILGIDILVPTLTHINIYTIIIKGHPADTCKQCPERKFTFVEDIYFLMVTIVVC